LILNIRNKWKRFHRTSNQLDHLRFTFLFPLRIVSLDLTFIGVLGVHFFLFVLIVGLVYEWAEVSTRSHTLTIQPVTSSINSFHYSFFVNSPFLWNPMPYTILQIKKSTLFRAALHHFLFLICIFCESVYCSLICPWNFFFFSFFCVCCMYVWGEYDCRLVLLYNPVFWQNK